MPEDEIDWKKKKQLVKMAQLYLSTYKIPFETPIQIDVVAITQTPSSHQIAHFENVIEDTY